MCGQFLLVQRRDTQPLQRGRSVANVDHLRVFRIVQRERQEVRRLLVRTTPMQRQQFSDLQLGQIRLRQRDGLRRARLQFEHEQLLRLLGGSTPM
jgi:hypothetical protein